MFSIKKPLGIEKKDKRQWIASRVIALYQALKGKIPPKEETSSFCNHCPFKSKCTLPKKPVAKTIVNISRVGQRN
jgi:hypothetical protein